MGAGHQPPGALTTSLLARHSFVNHAELPVLCAAFSTASQGGRVIGGGT